MLGQTSNKITLNDLGLSHNQPLTIQAVLNPQQVGADGMLAQTTGAAHYQYKPYQDDFFVSDMKSSGLPQKTT